MQLIVAAENEQYSSNCKMYAYVSIHPKQHADRIPGESNFWKVGGGGGLTAYNYLENLHS